MGLCLLNGLLSVSSVFWPLLPVSNFAILHSNIWTTSSRLLWSNCQIFLLPTGTHNFFTMFSCTCIHMQTCQTCFQAMCLYFEILGTSLGKLPNRYKLFPANLGCEIMLHIGAYKSCLFFTRSVLWEICCTQSYNHWKWGSHFLILHEICHGEIFLKNFKAYFKVYRIFNWSSYYQSSDIFDQFHTNRRVSFAGMYILVHSLLCRLI